MRRTLLLPLLLFAACSVDDGEATTTTSARDATSVLTLYPVLETLPAAACAEPRESDLFPEEEDGTVVACHRLGPPPVERVAIESADAVIDWEDSSGDTWMVAPVLTSDDDGIGALNALAEQCFNRTADCPTSRGAIVVDGQLVSAPRFQQPSFEPNMIVISGKFDEGEARDLAEALT